MKSTALPARIWDQLVNMKFAIIVLVVLAVVSVLSLFLGEFYPVRASGPGWQEFWRQELGMSRPLFNLFTFLELHDPYRSWWYQILLLLLSLSLAACIIERIPIALRAMRKPAPRSPDQVMELAVSRKFRVKTPAKNFMKRLPHSFRFTEKRADGEWRLSGLHGALAYFGPILTHSGLLCLALGGLFASWLGFSTRVGGLPGDILSDPGFDFQVRVDSFQIEYYPPGLGQYVLVDDSFIGKIVGRQGDDRFLLETMSPHREMVTIPVEKSRLRNQFDIEMDRGNIKDYITIATVIEDGEEVSRHRIEVNHPLRHKGYRFYQTSFDTENPRVEAHLDSALIEIKRLVDDTVLDTTFIFMNEPIALPDGSELVLADFLPDFRLDGSRASSASGELRNPAVLLEVHNGGREIYHQWSFLHNPFVHTSPEANYSFQLLDISGFKSNVTYSTILEVKKNPGTWLIWLGFILATLGLVLSFYLVPRRLWVVIKEDDKGTREVFMGGTSAKNPDLFARRFETWVQRLQS